MIIDCKQRQQTAKQWLETVKQRGTTKSTTSASPLVLSSAKTPTYATTHKQSIEADQGDRHLPAIVSSSVKEREEEEEEKGGGQLFETKQTTNQLTYPILSPFLPSRCCCW